MDRERIIGGYMVKYKLRKIIEEQAREYDIDPDLVEAFVVAESSGIPTATRYEANFYKTYIQPMLTKGASITPAEAIGRATSHGLMQIMGQVAREKGFKGEFKELLDPATGLHWALKHLKHFFDKYPGDIDQPDLAIAAYNAGSPRYRANGEFINQQYVTKIKKYLKMIKEA